MSGRNRIGTAAALVALGLLGFLLWAAWNMKGVPDTGEGEGEAVATDDSALLGRVLDPDGAPVRGAEVVAAPVRGGKPVRTRSDARGAFAFGALAAGPWYLDASAEGLVNPGPQDRRALRVVLDDTSAVEVDLRLRRLATVRGRVLLGDQPVAGAVLRMEVAESTSLAGPLRGYELPGGVSDAGGNFELAVPPGKLRLVAKARGDREGASDELALGDGTTREGVVLQLGDGRRAGAELRGAVRGPAGQPLAAMVEVYIEGGPPRAVKTETDGTFRLGALPAGTLRVRAAARGYGARETQVTLVEGEISQLEIVLGGGGGLRGKVVDSGGQPVAGATVLLVKGSLRSQLVSEADGTFQVDRPELLGEDATVQALSLTHADSDVATAVHEGDVTLTLRPGGEIRGFVQDHDGKPVPGSIVSVHGWAPVEPDPFSPQFIRPDRVANEEASFQLGPLRPGRYRLRGEAPGRSAKLVDDVVVGSGQLTDNVLIRLGVGGSVEGMVRDSVGQPVVSARVMVWEPGAVLPPKMDRSDEEGRYQIRGVSPGRLSIRVQHDEYLTAMESGVEVQEEQVTTRDLLVRKRAEGERFSFQGIGATLREEDGAIVVGGLMDDAPARAAGVQKGDRIVAVDGTTTLGMALSTVVERIRGEPGSTVLLDVERPGRGRVVISVPRGQVVVK